MPKFEIAAFERWDHVVKYQIEAPSLETAVRMITKGMVPYVRAEHQTADPTQEVLCILGVTNHDTQEQINDEGKLNSLLGCSFN
jgi:hypothetical protein